MTHLRDRRARLYAFGAASLLVSVSAASACPQTTLTGAAVSAAIGSGCTHGCGPTDCAGGRSQSLGSVDSSGRGGPVFDISVVEFTFVPNQPIIKPETTVRWTNNSTAFQHNVVRFGMWESPVLSPTEPFEFRFLAANAGFDYFYECTIHPGMEGNVKVTNFGDANLDGNVNLNDFNVLATNFGQSNRTWEQGDFNEDGTVNLNDFNLLAANFGKTIVPAPPGSTIHIDFGGGTVVPEPMVAAALALPLLGVRRRIKRG